jgi:hypothetical protein
MQTFYEILAFIGAIMILFVLFKTIKGRPDMFNKEAINKSFLTMGVLALCLIGFVALLIMMVRT